MAMPLRRGLESRLMGEVVAVNTVRNLEDAVRASLVLTNEIWSGALNRNGSHKAPEDLPPRTDSYVEVKLVCLNNGTWRVAVWGCDDHGMEFDTESEVRARRVICNLPVVLTFSNLRLLGFRNG